MSSQSSRSDLLQVVQKDLFATFESAKLHPAFPEVIGRMGWDEQALKEFVSSRLKHLQILAQSGDTTASPIPKVTHRIWLTNFEQPHLPPANYLDSIAGMSHELPDGWRSVFWTNSSEVAQQVSQKFLSADASVQVMDIGAVHEGSPLLPLVLRLVGERKYVLAADVAKIMVLSSEGGVYSDLGVSYSESLFSILESVDAAFVIDNQSFFQLSFLALPKSSALTSAWTSVLLRPSTLTAALYPPERVFGPVEEVGLLAGLGFTAATLCLQSNSERVLVLPYQGTLLKWSAQRSWYGSTEKFGNVIVRDSPLSVLNADAHRTRCNELETECIRIGNPSFPVARIKFLLGLAEHFRVFETPLCTVLNRYGSDKAKGWHNYAYLYYHLFGDLRGRAARVMEIGIGTNYTDTPSSMGASGKPGASLRAWREFMLNAQIVGADVDRRILFEEDSIQTRFVDQRDLGTLRALAHEFSDTLFDLIIDDGLHEFDANVNTFEGLWPALTPGGLFVIEDVVYRVIPDWQRFLIERGLNGMIVRPQNSKNPRDNCFVVIEKL